MTNTGIIFINYSPLKLKYKLQKIEIIKINQHQIKKDTVDINAPDGSVMSFE